MPEPHVPPRAVIFDCDGVIADTEPLHLRAFQAALASRHLTISPREYVERYLGLDDRGVFTTVLSARGETPSPDDVATLIALKAERLRGALAEARIYPGLPELVRRLAGIPLAVASGALRHEVDVILVRAGVRAAFAAVVTAEDVPAGKPDPAPFLTALAAVNDSSERVRTDVIAAAECLVIEDSQAGIKAARRAGMRCLAVTNSYPAPELHRADRVVTTLEGLTLESLRAIFA